MVTPLPKEEGNSQEAPTLKSLADENYITLSVWKRQNKAITAYVETLSYRSIFLNKPWERARAGRTMRGIDTLDDDILSLVFDEISGLVDRSWNDWNDVMEQYQYCTESEMALITAVGMRALLPYHLASFYKEAQNWIHVPFITMMKKIASLNTHKSSYHTEKAITRLNNMASTIGRADSPSSLPPPPLQRRELGEDILALERDCVDTLREKIRETREETEAINSLIQETKETSQNLELRDALFYHSLPPELDLTLPIHDIYYSILLNLDDCPIFRDLHLYRNQNGALNHTWEIHPAPSKVRESEQIWTEKEHLRAYTYTTRKLSSTEDWDEREQGPTLPPTIELSLPPDIHR
ncbi:hypothetical protein FGO68_gene7700 [Halteria grandinella]|uniref:Uncharacterized protein n=1 Tax=Halteria grandinella TaxID=5974 RepID=A0A8J8SVW0_HALGN|nr:hypothetical protein FGO68_gene7700 [Halteria grandinella]